MDEVQAWLRHPRVVRGCQIAIGLLFAFAGLAKIGDLRGFAEQIHNFRILPVAVENVMAMTLPWIEIVAALALVLGIRARAAALLAAGLLAVFTTAVVLALARGLDIECGCFGTADASRVGLLKVLENVGMLALAWVGTLKHGGRDATEESAGESPVQRARQARLRAGGRVVADAAELERSVDQSERRR